MGRVTLKTKLGRLTPPPGSMKARPAPAGDRILDLPETAVAAAPANERTEEAAADRRARVEALRRRLNRMQQGSRSKPAAVTHDAGTTIAHGTPGALPGERRKVRGGTIQVVDQSFAADYHYGDAPLHWAFTACAEALSFLTLAAEHRHADPRRFLFLDTETTGLAGGVGTIPFLIGVGMFGENGTLRVQQLVLPGPGQERPMLRYLAEQIAEASAVVTYNGKSFDWPLLRNRFVLNRLKVPSLPPHVDLLHAARRVYRRRLAAVRLVHVESEILGFVRHHDIDGALIPQRYFDYLDGGDGGLLTAVVEHNAYDIVALAALVGLMCRQVSDPAEAVGKEEAADLIGLAEVAWRQKDYERLHLFGQRALHCARDDEYHADAHLLLARMHKRQGDFPAAVAAYRAVLELTVPDQKPDVRGAFVHLQLAKIYEHRQRAYALAIQHARQAVLLEGPGSSGKRMARLRKKQGLARRKSSSAARPV